MIVTKTVMTEAQKAFMVEIEAKIAPLQSELSGVQDEVKALMAPVLEAKAKMKALQGKLLPLGMLKAGIVTPRSRVKYFPEFYDMTAEDVDETTIEGQSKIAQVGIIKDTDESIAKFIKSVRELLKSCG